MAAELVLATLGRTWEALRDQGIDACIMGGLALVHWGHARFTKDVDLLALLDPQAADQLACTLGSKGFVARRTPALSQVGKHSFLQFLYTPPGRFDKVPVDLLLADSDFLRTALQRAVLFNLDAVESRVVSCEDLIILKLQAERLIDRNDVCHLLEYNRPNLDFTYLTNWVIRLGLMKEWTEWWNDAFPGQALPEGGKL
jgi:hypothetical protein